MNRLEWQTSITPLSLYYCKFVCRRVTYKLRAIYKAGNSNGVAMSVTECRAVANKQGTGGFSFSQKQVSEALKREPSEIKAPGGQKKSQVRLTPVH
jgi:putative component of membrane protein insertase Oxa1/YidC/SpoIIIJ protein YidD